ncbi:MAG: hypothetical protein INR73_14700 [Williamsia sp.]|nr:hypothetical protein [Williamsia sp.]
MTTALLISIIGTFTAISVSLIGAWLANRNSVILQTRKLKEDHYITFIEALHYLLADNDNNDSIKNYVLARDKLLLIASEDVINKMLQFEKEIAGKDTSLCDEFLTELVKSLRIDLKIRDKYFPQVYMKTWKNKANA